MAKSHVNGLNERLSGLVEGLLKWQDEKNHFKAKVCFLSIFLPYFFFTKLILFIQYLKMKKRNLLQLHFLVIYFCFPGEATYRDACKKMWLRGCKEGDA